jgi:formyltetrahydrofolate deformylase
MPANRAVVSVVGRDQKGVVARVSTYLASCDVNIEDIEQHVLEGLFVMTMQVDVADLSCDLDDLAVGLREIGDELGMDVSLRLAGRPTEPKRIAVLVTKEAHCLEQLVRDHAAGRIDGEFVMILSNHPDLEPIAAEAGIPFAWLPSTDKQAHFDFLLERLAEVKPDLVVLARYMQVLPPQMVERYPSRIINIHPSLQPYHPGPNAYRQAWQEGVRVSGCTSHFVTEQLDAGPVILQDVFQIKVGEDSLERVKGRGQALEGEVLSRAVQLFANNQLLVKDNKVIFRPGPGVRP